STLDFPARRGGRSAGRNRRRLRRRRRARRLGGRERRLRRPRGRRRRDSRWGRRRLPPLQGLLLVMSGLLSTPRPVPGRRLPTLAGAGVVVVALPVFLVAGWALAAVLWLAGEALALWLGRLPTGADHLGMSGLVALAHSFRGIGVMIVLIAVTLGDRHVGIAALAVYALAYTLSLGVSLLEYFSGEKTA